MDSERLAQMQSSVMAIGNNPVRFYDLLKYIIWIAILLFIASVSTEELFDKKIEN